MKVDDYCDEGSVRRYDLPILWWMERRSDWGPLPTTLVAFACRPLFGLKISEVIDWNGLKLERQQIVLNIMEDLQTFLGIEELIIRVKRCFVVTRGRSAVAGLPPIKYNINGL